MYAPFATTIPVWHYSLAEAKIFEKRLNLGPVGGRIVTETLIGLLRADPTSHLNVLPGLQAVPGYRPPTRGKPNTSITGKRSYTHALLITGSDPDSTVGAGTDLVMTSDTQPPSRGGGPS